MDKNKKIEITLVKSSIGYNVKQKYTLEALGLRKMNQKITKNNSDTIQGMIRKVRHLVKVEVI